MLVAVALEHIISPAVEIFPVKVNDSNGAFNAKPLLDSVLV